MDSRTSIFKPWSLLAMLAALPVAAQAGEMFSFDLAAGQFDEHCVKLDAGTIVRYLFEASAVVDFNIHHHRANEVLYPVRRDGVTRVLDEFRAPDTDDYCLMWTNQGKAGVRVTGEVSR